MPLQCKKISSSYQDLSFCGHYKKYTKNVKNSWFDHSHYAYTKIMLIELHVRSC